LPFRRRSTRSQPSRRSPPETTEGSTHSKMRSLPSPVMRSRCKGGCEYRLGCPRRQRSLRLVVGSRPPGVHGRCFHSLAPTTRRGTGYGVRVFAGCGCCPTAMSIDSPTAAAADTVYQSSHGWDGTERTNGRKRHIAVDVNGLLLAVSSPQPPSRTAMPHTGCWPSCTPRSLRSRLSGATAAAQDVWPGG